MNQRIVKVNELIKEVVSDIISRRIQFPERMLVTVTRVAVAPNLYSAEVFITVFSSKRSAGDEALDMLWRNIRAIQREVNRKLRMRPVPRIAFFIDKEEVRRERVEKLLRDATSH